MKKLIAGNWKMNCSLDEAKALVAGILNDIYSDKSLQDNCDFLICPPYIYLPTIRHAVFNHGLLGFGAQDCSAEDNGSYTGDISALMLKESGCQYVIVGHSERRQFHKENNELIHRKARKAQENGLCPIICVGESESQREYGQAVDVVLSQIEQCLTEGSNSKNLVIAYEPVWAIGTGKTPTSEDIAEMHGAIREKLKEKLADGANIRILYGGSVKLENAGDILNIADVDGALIGGASLKADSFMGIARAIT